ncbi:Zinc finger transcription factor ace1 [Apiospora rasikravindrae]|uniref:Zinc finger transcription factor ace1 n=1 Tax=Apiospora rasikravindrae TaxID=990691 RepID=A0ABR1UDP2_9PEZI
MSSFSNPRRTAPVTRSDTDGSNGLRLKTNIALRKGATFHSPTTPPSSPPASTFKVPSLPRRSQTSLDDVIDSHRRRVMMTLGHIEDTLSLKPESSASRRSFPDDSLPVPKGFLDHTVAEPSSQEPGSMETQHANERRVLRPRVRRSSRHHESDSGLGTSVASKQSRAKDTKPSAIASAITRSATSIKSEKMPRLSQRAVNRIHEHTLKPLLAKPSLKEFESIILDCPRRIQENQIVCLRDLEKTLIFMAPVSQLLKDTGVWGNTYRALCLKERAKTAELYLDFCLTSIRCIQATVEYLSDHEQTRPHDRPYNNGYFIDLVDQIRRHAQQLQSARERQDAGEELDDMDVEPYATQPPYTMNPEANLTSTDEVKLMGGISSTGRPAELVRVKKNGKAISIATGQPVEDLDEDTKAPIRFKRSMSEQLEDEEEIMRSMARRKKNADPSEYAPKKCKEPGCNKEFKRPCDLTKHEKTHSRPWKCPHPTCKYHEYGWPTEKEMDRHINDKHSSAPPMYECLFKPCPYKSKRESNCKQHMEKAHGWTYVRTKTNKKGGSEKGSSSANPTPMIQGIPTPSSEGTSMMTPPEEPLINFPDMGMDMDMPNYASSEEFNADFDDSGMFDPVLGSVPFDTEINLDYSPIENGTPSTDAGQFTSYNELSPDVTGQFEDIYGAHVQLPTPTHSVYDCNKMFTTTFADESVPAPVAHISPVGHGNTMLYTPLSMADVDEGFDEFPSGDFGNDFLLFPPSGMGKTDEFDAGLFLTTPSAAAGFSQPSSQEFNLDFGHSMDWTNDYSSFQPQN